MLELPTGIARRPGDAVKVIGKFLLWVLAYAMGAGLIFVLSRRPAPPPHMPEPAPPAEAPADSPDASEPAAPNEPAPPRDEAVAPPAPVANETSPSSPPPRRVKAIRIPSR
jgi:hypothetical protein